MYLLWYIKKTNKELYNCWTVVLVSLCTALLQLKNYTFCLPSLSFEIVIWPWRQEDTFVTVIPWTCRYRYIPSKLCSLSAGLPPLEHFVYILLFLSFSQYLISFTNSLLVHYPSDYWDQSVQFIQYHQLSPWRHKLQGCSHLITYVGLDLLLLLVLLLCPEVPPNVF